ncbi:MAG: MarC family protein [Paludibacter sp.]|nr:MarC family protein [Paludibacter sp.]MDD4199700.1 MarC family protein [Paludibacter sp.]MDD4428702.1 MarC family protein [Paludibacter sp.]
MNFSFIEITSAFMVLFAIIDILGSIPIILNIKKKDNKIYAFWASFIALVILILFLFTGEGVLNLFNVDIQSFAVAGALIIFIFAIEMILDIEIFRNNGPKNSSSFIPLAFPLIAGPGSFTTLLSLRAEYQMENIIIALVLNLAFVYLVLKSTDRIEKLFGEAGIYILRKFFGIILLAISVKLFTTNLTHLLQ